LKHQAELDGRRSQAGAWEREKTKDASNAHFKGYQLKTGQNSRLAAEFLYH